MKHELVLKNGKVLDGEEIYFHGDLTSITKTRKKGLFRNKIVKDVNVVFSGEVCQINFIDVEESELENLMSGFETSSEEQPTAEKKVSSEDSEEVVLNTPLSEVMYN